MTEADIIEQLVALMNVVLAGVSVYFTLVSAYIVALWAFLGRAKVVLRVFAFLFFTAGFAFLVAFFLGVSNQHSGLIETLIQIRDEQGYLTPASSYAIANTWEGLDNIIQIVMWSVGIGIYVCTFLLTFNSRTLMKPQLDD